MRLSTACKVAVVVLLPASGALAALMAAGIVAAGAELLVYSGLIAAAHAVVGLGLAVALERGKAPWLMRIGVLLTAGSLLLWIGVLWTSAVVSLRSEWMRGAAAILSGWAALSMVVGVALAQPAAGRCARWARRLTIGLAAALAVAWTAFPVVFFGSRLASSVVARVIGALATLGVASLLTQLTAERLAAGDGGERRRSRGPQVRITCPRCEADQRIDLDGDRCRRCGLRIKVQVP